MGGSTFFTGVFRIDLPGIITRSGNGTRSAGGFLVAPKCRGTARHTASRGATQSVIAGFGSSWKADARRTLVGSGAPIVVGVTRGSVGLRRPGGFVLAGFAYLAGILWVGFIGPITDAVDQTRPGSNGVDTLGCSPIAHIGGAAFGVVAVGLRRRRTTARNAGVHRAEPLGQFTRGSVWFWAPLGLRKKRGAFLARIRWVGNAVGATSCPDQTAVW